MDTPLDTRREQRIKLAFRAIATDRHGLTELSCLIRDGSASGCRLVSEHIDVLPEAILLRIKGISEPIPGRIVWRRKRMAGVKFQWKAAASADQRRARRHDTSLRARVTGVNGGEGFEGMIVDASVSGARLWSADVDRLPDAIIIEVEGIAAPIPGRIVWRKQNEAGVALKFPEASSDPSRRNDGAENSEAADEFDIMQLQSGDIVELDS